MGRAYEVRKASIQKTGAAKGKLYSIYAREIYQAAKNGGAIIENNVALKRLVEKAKKDQIPGDIIKRAIDKVNSGVDENYTNVRYEGFGPAGSTVIIDCLTDNVNRTLSGIRPAFNKTDSKLGAIGSVVHMYDNLCIVSFKGLDEETVLNALIEADIDINDIENENDLITVYGNPTDLYKIKTTIQTISPSINFEMDEIAMLPKEKINLDKENLEIFQKLLNMLDECEDVNNVYHNVNL